MHPSHRNIAFNMRRVANITDDTLSDEVIWNLIQENQILSLPPGEQFEALRYAVRHYKKSQPQPKPQKRGKKK